MQRKYSIIRLETRLESSRSPSEIQPLTLLQGDILHHAERFVNATFCSYVTAVHQARLAWHLSRRARKKVVDGDVVWVPTRVHKMSE